LRAAALPVPGWDSVIRYSFCSTDLGFGCAREGMSVGGLDRLVQIGQNVADILDAHREPHQLGRDPVVACSSTESCWCVVEAGWITSDLASPMLATSENSSSESISFFPAS
jgi:hypothetical protein